MQRRAVIVHLNALPKVVPLVGGYLKAFAHADPDLKRDFRIDLYGAHASTPLPRIVDAIVLPKPDVVAFSVYVWNVRAVLRLVAALRTLLPGTEFLLGGVEVMNLARQLFPAAPEDVAVCNGEGEVTFRAYLQAILARGQGRPPLETVPGLSYARDGSWHDGDPVPRIRDLAEIPSPYLNDLFAPADLEFALFETNRGCPFACEFCFWGGAVGAKVNKLEMDRVKEELRYMSRHRTSAIHIADANFGLLPRDIELAELMVSLHRETGYPERVLYTSAKNSERVVDVARIFAKGGLAHAHPIALQSVSEEALRLAKRSNIKTERYIDLQRELSSSGIATYIELIWPLPGETLESFKDGLDRLCGMGAQAFVVHTLQWLRNVGYEAHEDEYGVVTRQVDDRVGAGRFVVQTKDVTRDEFLSGHEFAAALYALFDCRALYVTMHVLAAIGAARFRDVVDAFLASPSVDPIHEIFRKRKDAYELFGDIGARGEIAEQLLGDPRAACDAALADFVRSNPAFLNASPELVEAALEFDLVNRPYLFESTPLGLGVALRHLRILEQGRRAYRVEAPYDFPRIVARARTGDLGPADFVRGRFTFTVDYRTPKIRPGGPRWRLQIVRGLGRFEARYPTGPGPAAPEASA